MRDAALAQLPALAADEGATFMAAALAVNDCVNEAFDRTATEQALKALSDRYDDRLTPWAFLREVGFGGRSPADVVLGSRIDAVPAPACRSPWRRCWRTWRRPPGRRPTG